MILAIVIGIVVIFLIVAGFLALHFHPHHPGKPEDPLQKAAVNNAEHIFDDQFREELRNRGRLHFEKIISENAMFLQQDLRLTTSQLNDYMKSEITRKLQEEFAKYEQAITDAKELAVESIHKTNVIIEEQRKVLSDQLSAQYEAEKSHMLARLEEDLADIVNHYVLTAVGNQIDLSDQLEYIMGELEANKAAIAEDVKNGL